jgi:hypothetical protein
VSCPYPQCSTKALNRTPHNFGPVGNPQISQHPTECMMHGFFARCISCYPTGVGRRPIPTRPAPVLPPGQTRKLRCFSSTIDWDNEAKRNGSFAGLSSDRTPPELHFGDEMTKDNSAQPLLPLRTAFVHRHTSNQKNKTNTRPRRKGRPPTHKSDQNNSTEPGARLLLALKRSFWLLYNRRMNAYLASRMPISKSGASVS